MKRTNGKTDSDRALTGRTGENRPWIKYLVAAGAGAVAALLLLISRGAFNSGISGMDRLLVWCDSLFIVGSLMACFGGLLFVSGQGAFDGISYAARSFTWLFTFKKNKRESYAEFKERRSGNKKSFLYMLVVGGIYLAAAGILNAVFTAKLGA